MQNKLSGSALSTILNGESKSAVDADLVTASPRRSDALSSSPTKKSISKPHTLGESHAEEKGSEGSFFLTHSEGDSLVAGKTQHSNASIVAETAKEAKEDSAAQYIESLEKALNKEQIHAQHLAQKNETLIKELEELKAL